MCSSSLDKSSLTTLSIPSELRMIVHQIQRHTRYASSSSTEGFCCGNYGELFAFVCVSRSVSLDSDGSDRAAVGGGRRMSLRKRLGAALSHVDFECCDPPTCISVLNVSSIQVIHYQSWTCVGSTHGSGLVGLCQVGSQNSPSWVGRVGSGPLSKIANKYTIYTQEIDYSATIICNDKKL